jgi:hypothetical protein
MFNLCWSNFCTLIPEVKRQNPTGSESRRKINQTGKLQINLDKKILGKLRWGEDSIWNLDSPEKYSDTLQGNMCGPYDHFTMRVRTCVSVAITLVQVPGQPYLHRLIHVCVSLEGRCLGQEEKGHDAKTNEQKWLIYIQLLACSCCTFTFHCCGGKLR